MSGTKDETGAALYNSCRVAWKSYMLRQNLTNAVYATISLWLCLQIHRLFCFSEPQNKKRGPLGAL